MVLKQRLQAINKTEILTLFLILCIGVFLRFSGLGYSHFYGDETKTLYLNKTIPAFKFLLDQRKGPVQYIAAWTVEKITNGYNEFFIRTPFAIAGIFSVLVFYLLVKKFFNWKESLISTFLFCVSGFSIAFSRTAQYQSFLILFGLLSIYFFISALENKKKSWYLLASLTLAASFYSHYDAIFFLVPIIYIFFSQSDRNYKEIILFFAAPCAAVLSLFYLPYVFGGYLFSNTVNYVARRINGSDYGSNSYSFYTFWIYNPLFLHFINITLSLLYILFIKPKDKIRDLFLYWFLIPFIFFNGVIANPGTHIHNYFIPLYMVSGPSILWIFSLVKNQVIRYLTS